MPGHDKSSRTPIAALRSGIRADRHGDRNDAYAKKDRLSPPLMLAFRAAHEARDARKKLDLRDQSGERIIAGRRSTGRHPISEALLRREVSHDLETLLNTIALESTLDMSGRDCVRTSILNYGLPDIANRSIDEVTDDELSDALRASTAHL